MNKLELIAQLQKENNIPKYIAARTVRIFFDSMADALEIDERVEIRGFCSFYLKEYAGYIGRNPKTGKKVAIKPKRLPFFKCGKELRARVDYN